MTLRIEKSRGCLKTTISLIGQVHRENIGDLKAQIASDRPDVAFDLAEVTLVDVDVIRFLGACEFEGIEIRNSSRYIREWMLRERERSRDI